MDQSFSIALPLKRKVRLDPGELITEIRLFVEETGATVKIDPRMINQPARSTWSFTGLVKSEPEKVLFEVGGVRMRVTVINEPFYERSRIHRFVNPAMWSAGLGEFADHRAHVLIREAGIEGEEGPDAVFDRAAAVTATASVITRLTEPVGAIWVSSRNAVPMSTFHAMMDRLKGGEAPLKLWVRWHIIPPGQYEEACPGVVTAGLAPFTGREIQASPSANDPRVMIDYAFELARQLVDERLTIDGPGDIKTADGAPLKLRLRGPGANSDSPVFEIALPQKPMLEARRPVEPAGGGLGIDPEAARAALAEMGGLPDIPPIPPVPPLPDAVPAVTGEEDAAPQGGRKLFDPVARPADGTLPPPILLPDPSAADLPKAPAPDEDHDLDDGGRVYAAAGGRRIRVITGGKGGR